MTYTISTKFKTATRKLNPDDIIIFPKHKGTPLNEKMDFDHASMNEDNSWMHEDPYSTDSTNSFGVDVNKPISITRVNKKKGIGGMFATFIFDKEDALYTESFSIGGGELYCFDKEGNRIGQDVLLKRPFKDILKKGAAFMLKPSNLFRDTSGGPYYFINDEGYWFVPSSKNEIWVFRKEGNTIKEIARFNEGKKKISSPITAMLPDYDDPNSLWMITKNGEIIRATYDFNVSTESFVQLHRLKLKDVVIQNSFSLAGDGIYIVTSKSLVRVSFTTIGTKEKIIATRYKDYEDDYEDIFKNSQSRKDDKKLVLGSGTTPTLIDFEADGIEHKYVAICDKAEKMKVLIYRRGEEVAMGEKPVLSIPVFPDYNEGTKLIKINRGCENSMIAYDRYLLIGNTSSYSDPFAFEGDTPGGVIRINILDALKFRSDYNNADWNSHWLTVKDKKKPFLGHWYNQEANVLTATPKLSLKQGLVYAYTTTKEENGKIYWCLKAINFETGKVYFKILISEFKKRGTFIRKDNKGIRQFDEFDNAWATVSVGRNNDVFVGLYTGMIIFKNEEAGFDAELFDKDFPHQFTTVDEEELIKEATK